MSQTVEEYISENGIEPVFTALGEFKNGDASFFKFADENNIDEDSWYEFGWLVNDYLGTYRGGVIPLVDFNDRKIEREAEAYVQENAPVDWDTLVTEVAESVPSASKTNVEEWLEFATITKDTDGDTTKITSVTFD